MLYVSLEALQGLLESPAVAHSKAAQKPRRSFKDAGVRGVLLLFLHWFPDTPPEGCSSFPRGRTTPPPAPQSRPAWRL